MASFIHRPKSLLLFTNGPMEVFFQHRCIAGFQVYLLIGVRFSIFDQGYHFFQRTPRQLSSYVDFFAGKGGCLGRTCGGYRKEVTVLLQIAKSPVFIKIPNLIDTITRAAGFFQHFALQRSKYIRDSHLLIGLSNTAE